MKLLHILNGDATLFKFQKTGLPGDVIVWREVLSEGPVDKIDTYHDFFYNRSKWIKSTYNSEPADYNRKVIYEFNRLKTCTQYDEVIFWFEFDLFCQINLIFLLDYLNKRNLGNTVISLVCPDSHPHYPDFRGIGQLSPEELAELILDKVTLTQSDLTMASTAWVAYAKGEKEEIEHLLDFPFGQLDKLKPALQAHLERFPDEETGLNSIDNLLISITNSGITSRSEIYNEFWKTTAIYGMGDAQIDTCLKELVNKNLIPRVN
ncbi:MAG: hypothetical protein JWN56_1948 [Sphingobacteriales bacterium]|nr:hypothetical protein [Sphingobacteriales bacterium]